MSTVIFEAMIVSGDFYGSPTGITEAHQLARAIGLSVTEIVKHTMNGSSTFLVVPDGSGEGYAHHREHNDRRREFKERCRTGKFHVDIVQISYGQDCDRPYIVDGYEREETLQEKFERLERHVCSIGEVMQDLQKRIRAGEV